MSIELKFPRLVVHPKTGDEPFHAGGSPLPPPLQSATLGDFWSWACSDLVGNSLRGLIAEYLVARAVGSEQRVRVEWDAYDVLAPGELRIEVKTSGYLQSWQQKQLSAISFDIAPKRSWSADTNTYSAEPARAAHVYVFAVHHHEDKATVDPLDVTQWTFHVVPTRLLNARCAQQRTLSLAALQRLGAIAVDFGDLAREIAKVARARLSHHDFTG